MDGTSPRRPSPRPRPRSGKGSQEAGGGPVWAALAAAAALVLAGCLGPGAGPEPGAGSPEPWGFSNATAGSGLTHVVGSRLPEGLPVFYTVVGSASTADVDGDGLTDLFVGDYGPHHLYRNLGNGSFEEVTREAGLGGSENFTTAGLWFDLGGDGDLDLFTTNYGQPAHLYRNQGDGTFVDVTDEAGVGNDSYAYGASAADVDGDGDLDLTVVNYDSAEGGRQASPYTNATNGQRDFLYLNQGDGTFREVGLQRGLTATRWSFSHAWNDVDGDGDPDLHVNVDFGYDILYENDGTGNFTPVTRQAGLVTNRNGMGAVWADVENDRDLDLFITNIFVPGPHEVDALKGNNLFVQGPDGRFRDEAAARGVADGGWGWDSQWFDADLDGDIDAAQANGEYSAGSPDIFYNVTPTLSPDPPRKDPEARYTTAPKYNATHWMILRLKEGFTMGEDYSVAGYQQDRFFVNDGTGNFTDQARSRGLGGWADSRAYAVLDLGRDGDLDLVRTATGRRVQLFRNTAADTATGDEPRHWLQLELRSDPPNTRAVGARVTARAGNLTLLRQAETGGGFMSHDPPGFVHLGLGEHAVVDELRVRWPDGETVTFEDVEADRRLRVIQGQGLEPVAPP